MTTTDTCTCHNCNGHYDEKNHCRLCGAEFSRRDGYAVTDPDGRDWHELCAYDTEPGIALFAPWLR